MQPPGYSALGDGDKPGTMQSQEQPMSKSKPKLLKSKTPKATQPPHLIVEARAGTGKTTTLLQGLRLVFGQQPTLNPSPQQQAVWDAMALSAGQVRTAAFVAFNKAIAAELKSKVPQGVDAMTNHGMGFKAVIRAFPGVKVEQYRVDNIIADMLGFGDDTRSCRKEEGGLVSSVKELVGLCKMNLVGWKLPVLIKGSKEDELEIELLWRDQLTELVREYGLELEADTGKVFSMVPKVLERCKDVERDRQIDFDDMIWLPVELGLHVTRYDLLLVDECLPGWTPVMMGDGSSKQIKDIQIGDQVRSYDTSRGRAKNCRVSAVQKLPNQKPLVKIRVRHNHKTEGNRKRNFVVCTIDHKIWTVNRGWVQAGEVQMGDTVIVETAASTTQKGKITKSGRDKLSDIHVGNAKGVGQTTRATTEKFNSIKGGNGRGLTTPQKLLLESLGEGWVPEYVVSTGGRNNGYPTHYKIDVANPEYKVAIEVDGNSHQGAQERDDRKTKFLEGLGWTVFRVTNRQLARDFAGVLQDVCPDGTRCPMPATVDSVEETYITEHHVYDITVEECHNFYANGILVHNCQDLNRCQQELAKMAGKRLILCGDPKQAIYGFAGADAQSMPRMLEDLTGTEYGCTMLPLTVTRRCGKAIVRKAQELVPDFQAFDANPDGRVLEARMENDKQRPGTWYREMAKPGDMVLCRVNAPLVSECFGFIRAGRKANIQGRDVGRGLIKLVQKLIKQTSLAPVTDLITELSTWTDSEVRKEMARKNPNDAKIQAIHDRADCLICFAQACKADDRVDSVILKIQEVFTDDKTSRGIMLSSIHRSKGLEADTVFFINTEKACCPHPMAKTPSAREQEKHLFYVAVTRAINTLVMVS